MTKRLRYSFFWLGIIPLIMSGYVNCAKAPQVELGSAMSVASTYTHTGLEGECLSCHASERPTNTNGFLGLNTKAPFDYNTHGNGMDCITCHADMSSLVRTRVNWANGYFMHKQTLTSCSECHSSNRPATTAGGSAHPAAGDCLSCHTPSLTAVKDLPSSSYITMDSILWKNATGVPTTSVWDSSKDLQVLVKNPNYGANGILSNWTTATQTLHMPMNHSVQLAGLNIAQCSSCHGNTTSYVGGRFHASVTSLGISQPATCLTCHDSSQANIIPVPITPTATVAFVGPASGISPTTNPSSFNHSSASGQQDCTTCHQQASWATPKWTLGQFHRTNNVPSTCQDCHSPARPAGLAGASLFNHSINGLGECAGCHTGAANALLTKTAFSASPATKLTVTDWAGASITPTGLVGSTTIAVSAVKLTTTNGAVTGKTASSQNLVLQFNHSAFQTNCTTCHTGASGFTGAKFHPNQATQPTSCKTCHTGALETFVVGYPVQKSIDHSHASVSALDCAKCHTSPTAAAASLLFKDGIYHAKLTTQPTTCKECHSPKILDQPIWGSMNHASIGTSDCKTCHTFPGTGVLGSATNPPNWKGSSGGMPANVSLTPPTGQNWGNLTVPHPAMVLSGISCASCHGTSTAARIVGYDHVNPPTGIKCVYCHFSSQTVVGTVTGFQTKSHEGASLTKDCNSSGCHNTAKFNQFSFPAWNATTKKWSGGKWK